MLSFCARDSLRWFSRQWCAQSKLAKWCTYGAGPLHSDMHPDLRNPIPHPSKPLSRLHQPQIQQLPRMPLKRGGVVPFEGVNVIPAARIAFQRFGGAE